MNGISDIPLQVSPVARQKVTRDTPGPASPSLAPEACIRRSDTSRAAI